jgi:putative heme-binding domain-containing protein
MVASAEHDQLWEKLSIPGRFRLEGQLDLSNMLHPVTQVGSTLDYTPEPETVTVTFASDSPLSVKAPQAVVTRVDDRTWKLVAKTTSNTAWQSIELNVTTPVGKLEAFFHTDRDPRPRAISTQRFFAPFAVAPAEETMRRDIPEIADGDWESGRQLFYGKAACSTCHTFRGEGFAVGPDLNNLVHRDYASTLRDIVDPNAVINPDAITYIAELEDGSMVTGIRFRDNLESLELAQQNGKIVKLGKSEIVAIKPLGVSLMPSDLDKILAANELRDLMKFLLIDREQGD